jgi:hypothetical protein
MLISSVCAFGEEIFWLELASDMKKFISKFVDNKDDNKIDAIYTELNELSYLTKKKINAYVYTKIFNDTPLTIGDFNNFKCFDSELSPIGISENLYISLIKPVILVYRNWYNNLSVK